MGIFHYTMEIEQPDANGLKVIRQAVEQCLLRNSWKYFWELFLTYTGVSLALGMDEDCLGPVRLKLTADDGIADATLWYARELGEEGSWSRNWRNWWFRAWFERERKPKAESNLKWFQAQVLKVIHEAGEYISSYDC